MRERARRRPGRANIVVIIAIFSSSYICLVPERHPIDTRHNRESARETQSLAAAQCRRARHATRRSLQQRQQ